MIILLLILILYNLFYMSTLAAARADNFYYSKAYDPKNVPAKKQANTPFKVVEGERVGGSKVRYETPFHVRCEKCKNMVAKGVRFNSIKTWVDNFHSTKIYQFRMKCPHCPQKFVVRTDPENCEYNYLSGAKRIFQTKDCTDESRIRDEAIQEKIHEDPFFKLEVQHNDKQKYLSYQSTLEQMQEKQDRQAEDFQLNRALRKQVKRYKVVEQQYLAEKRQKNLYIPLLQPLEQDQKKANKIGFKTKPIKKEEKLEHKKTEREKLKQKLKNVHPNFRKILKSEIKSINKSQTSLASSQFRK